MHRSTRALASLQIAVALMCVSLPVSAKSSTIPDSFDGGSFKHLFSIAIESAAFITTDYLGNIYVVDRNEINKYTAKGTLICSFSDKISGSISSVDVSNPLRVQVFYQDFGQIIYLDDVLSVIGSRISLVDQGLDQATLSCSSWDDGIWLYDPQDFELKRLGSDLRLSHQSGNINQLLGIEVSPDYILEVNNYVYLNDPSSGILVFDQFGTYYKSLPVKGAGHFQVSGNQVFYLSSNRLMSYDFKTFQFAEMTISSDLIPILDMRFEKELNRLIILKEKQLDIFVYQD